MSTKSSINNNLPTEYTSRSKSPFSSYKTNETICNITNQNNKSTKLKKRNFDQFNNQETRIKKSYILKSIKIEAIYDMGCIENEAYLEMRKLFCEIQLNNSF